MKEQILNPFQSIIDMLQDMKQTISSLESANKSTQGKVEIVDRKELAKRLGVTYRTIINLESQKKIKGFKIGRLTKYDFNEVINSIRNKHCL